MHSEWFVVFCLHVLALHAQHSEDWNSESVMTSFKKYGEFRVSGILSSHSQFKPNNLCCLSLVHNETMGIVDKRAKGSHTKNFVKIKVPLNAPQSI